MILDQVCQVSFNVYRQNVFFNNSTREQSFLREIAYPIEESQVEIKKYVKKSLRGAHSIKLRKAEKSICFLNVSDKNEPMEANIISKYWIDGETYLINYKKNKQEHYFFVIIDVDLDKESIFNMLKRDQIGYDVLHIDYLNDCWIKKNLSGDYYDCLKGCEIQ